ncbi:MAG TPA: hypothetical protein VM598_15040, partial [Bdellovibrionota bacterium]|nr:hypothetical protein [Bdellovibrionota bacterium]
GLPRVELEEPRSYRLDEAIERAFTQRFESRIEFERVMQARHLAARSYRELLPHFGIGSILALATANVSGILGSIGDLAPFLFPSRWQQARQDAFLAQAERDSLLVMRGNSGVQLEGFAYAIARDLAITRHYEEAIGEAERLRDLVRSLESMGALPIGSWQLVETSIHRMRDEHAAVGLGLRQALRHSAQALGLMNPEAVTALVLSADQAPIEAPEEIDTRQLLETAVQRSIEVRQAGFAIEAARVARRSVSFSWLDPAGESSLGFGFPSRVEIARSRITELEASRAQLQSIVLQKASEAAEAHSFAVAAHARAREDLALQEARVARIRRAVEFGAGPTQLDLATALLDRLRARASLETSVAAYRLSRAKIDRLLLRGHYSRLELQPRP